MKNNIPIFFSIDDNYLNYFLVTLESLKENADKNNHYSLYILYTSLSSKTKKIIKKYQDKNYEISFVDMSETIDKISDSLCTRDYYTKTTYFRLFISDMFKDIDKALYLDSDICVLNDISKLYNTDLGDNIVGAVCDQSVQLIDEFKTYVTKCLGLDYKKYFNAGILVMNFKKMREISFSDKVVDLLSTYEFKVAQDQDILNVICANKTKLINTSWNQMPLGKKNDNPNIIHYNLIYKPWKMNDVMYEEYFWKYALKSGRVSHILEEKGEMFFDDISRFENIMNGLKSMCVEEAYKKTNYYSLVFEGR